MFMLRRRYAFMLPPHYYAIRVRQEFSFACYYVRFAAAYAAAILCAAHAAMLLAADALRCCYAVDAAMP